MYAGTRISRILLARGLLFPFIRSYRNYDTCYHTRYGFNVVFSQTRVMSVGHRTSYRGLMMIKPAAFGANTETASSNVYQENSINVSDEEVQAKATEEFGNLLTELQEHNIEVRMFNDTQLPKKPDAVFPNNWISFHEDKKIAVYPMYSKVRRAERRDDIIQTLVTQSGYDVVDYTYFEKEAKYLEGTGSMVLDRINKIAYACKSVRTHPEVVDAFCQDFGYTPVIFEAYDKNVAIYHTNVMMSVAEEFAVICTDCIVDKHHVMDSLKATGKHIVNLSVEQIGHFCGNMLPVYDRKGVGYLVMSTRAFEALSANQVKDIERYCKIIHSPIPVIETLGGGSVRCMLAEVF